MVNGFAVSKVANQSIKHPTLKTKNSNQPRESLADSLPCKALHLDVEELSEVTEPFNHLGGHAAVELDRQKTRHSKEPYKYAGRTKQVFFSKGLNRLNQ